MISCQNYVEKFVGAHADDKLDAEQERAAAEHLEGCDRCRVWLESERYLKKLLLRNLRAAMPKELRAKILATIEDESIFGYAR